MQRGEIYLASFPFGDVPGMKLRSVLLLTEPIGPNREVLVAYISSVVPSLLLPSDILLDSSQTEAQATNLKVTSVLRLHKLNQTARHWHSPVGAKHLREGCLLCGDAAGKCFAPTPRRVHCPNVLWSDLAFVICVGLATVGPI
jgi:mRNA interferase MazF